MKKTKQNKNLTYHKTKRINVRPDQVRPEPLEEIENHLGLTSEIENFHPLPIETSRILLSVCVLIVSLGINQHSSVYSQTRCTNRLNYYGVKKLENHKIRVEQMSQMTSVVFYKILLSHLESQPQSHKSLLHSLGTGLLLGPSQWCDSSRNSENYERMRTGGSWRQESVRDWTKDSDI